MKRSMFFKVSALALCVVCLMFAGQALAAKPFEGKTLQVIMIADPWEPAFQKINPEFEELTGAKVVINSYSYDATHEKQVLEGSQKSDAFDVIVLDCPWVGEFWEAGYVEDLKPYIEKSDPNEVLYDDFVEVFRVVSEWKGHIVGMPFGAYFVTLDYRKDLFDKEGLTPPKPLRNGRRLQPSSPITRIIPECMDWR